MDAPSDMSTLLDDAATDDDVPMANGAGVCDMVVLDCDKVWVLSLWLRAEARLGCGRAVKRREKKEHEERKTSSL